jgi:hypothetical protein
MEWTWSEWLEWGAKIVGALATGAGVLVAAINYLNQTKLKRAEWVKSLFEKFFESSVYKEVRGWLDYDELPGRLTGPNQRENEEKFTDFLNFFEFIGVLYSRGQIKFEEVYEIFDYYLKKIKDDPNCKAWIEKYGFEKLKALLERV